METWMFTAIYLPVMFSRFRSRAWIGLISIAAVGTGQLLDAYALHLFTRDTAWLWYCLLSLVSFGWAIVASISPSHNALRGIAVMAAWYVGMAVYALIFGWGVGGEWGDPLAPYQEWVVVLIHCFIACSAFTDRGTNALDLDPRHCALRLGRVAMFQARKEERR